jgi:hypothetical protein
MIERQELAYPPVPGQTEYNAAVSIDRFRMAMRRAESAIEVLGRGDTGVWTPETTITAEIETGCALGYNLALRGTTLVATGGACFANGPGSGSTKRLHVFERDGAGIWNRSELVPTLSFAQSSGYCAVNPRSGKQELAFDGSRVAVVARCFTTSTAVFGLDAILVYRRTGAGTFVREFERTLPIGDPRPFTSIQINEDTLVVGRIGGPGDPSLGSLFPRGIVEVYRQSNGTWSALQTMSQVTRDGYPGGGQYFGARIELHGDYLAISSAHDTVFQERPYVIAYRRGGDGRFSEIAVLGSGDTYDGFGASLALNGDALFIGADRLDNAGDNSFIDGGVYLVRLSGQNGAVMTGPFMRTVSTSRYGSSLASSGVSLIIGARLGHSLANESW